MKIASNVGISILKRRNNLLDQNRCLSCKGSTVLYRIRLPSKKLLRIEPLRSCIRTHIDTCRLPYPTVFVTIFEAYHVFAEYSYPCLIILDYWYIVYIYLLDFVLRKNVEMIRVRVSTWPWLLVGGWMWTVSGFQVPLNKLQDLKDLDALTWSP